MAAIDRISHSRPTWVSASTEAVRAVLESGMHATGHERALFEEEFRARLGVEHAFAVTSGHAALELALRALGVERGAPVVVPSYACAALLNCTAAVGAHTLVADIDRATLSLSPESIRRACARTGVRPRDLACAIVPHMFGFPVDLRGWESHPPIIEDCAMALGARIGGRPAGTFGRLAIFSFYATKMITTGQGGMVVTREARHADRLRDLLQYDTRAEWRPSYNLSLTDIAAALGRVQFRELDRFVARRSQLAARYSRCFVELGFDAQRLLPGTESSHFRALLFAADLEERQRIIAALAADGIEAKSPVFEPLHRYLRLPADEFPVTEEVHARTVSIPIYPSLLDSEQERVVRSLERAFARSRRREAAQ